MVVILPPDSYDHWLKATPQQSMEFMRQHPAEQLLAVGLPLWVDTYLALTTCITVFGLWLIVAMVTTSVWYQAYCRLCGSLGISAS